MNCFVLLCFVVVAIIVVGFIGFVGFAVAVIATYFPTNRIVCVMRGIYSSRYWLGDWGCNNPAYLKPRTLFGLYSSLYLYFWLVALF